jgi:urease accessory protein
MHPDPSFAIPVFAHDLAELRLRHLSDSAFPIGALAHSFGLETLASQGILQPSGLPEFFHAYLEEAGSLEAVFCREAHRLGITAAGNFDAPRWVEMNSRLSALRPGRESRLGSASLGWNFLNALTAVDASATLRHAVAASKQAARLVHHCAAFGLSCGALEIEEDRAVLAYLHQSVAGLLSACQRLLPLGQTEATRILWNLKPAIAEAASRSATLTIENAACFMPLLDWGAMDHPALATRLFIS